MFFGTPHTIKTAVDKNYCTSGNRILASTENSLLMLIIRLDLNAGIVFTAPFLLQY